MSKRTHRTMANLTEAHGPRHSRPVSGPVKARDLLPELAPADVEAAANRGVDATAADLRDLPASEARLARITVYALNATVMIFAMPVGAALLVLNVFRGEDLRATAHGLALTGAWLGFMSTPQGTQFISGLL